MDCAHVIKKLFNRWLSPSKFETFNQLTILLEQFSRVIVHDVNLHLLKKGVNSLSRAVKLAENYSLMHKRISFCSNSRPDKPTQISLAGPGFGLMIIRVIMGL